jgi:hypothetical protein
VEKQKDKLIEETITIIKEKEKDKANDILQEELKLVELEKQHNKKQIELKENENENERFKIIEQKREKDLFDLDNKRQMEIQELNSNYQNIIQRMKIDMKNKEKERIFNEQLIVLKEEQYKSQLTKKEVEIQYLFTKGNEKINELEVKLNMEIKKNDDDSMYKQLELTSQIEEQKK